MAIITISRGSYSKGKVIAEKVAEKLGYECTSRDVLLDASEEFNIPEIKLIRALHDAPSILHRHVHGKERYVAFIEKTFLEHMQRDNVVYHGLAGHFFLKDVGHALKVRIIADLEDRVKLEMERENISRDKALHIIQNDDAERCKWAQHLYGIDTADPALYDLVLHIHKLSVEDAVDIICHTVKRPCFKTTPESQQFLEDILLAARARIKIVGQWPHVEVEAKQGIIHVKTKVPRERESKLVREMTKYLEAIDGVKGVEVHTDVVMSMD